MKFTAKRLFALLLALLLTVSSFAFAEEEPVVTVEAVDETYDSIEAEFGADEDAGFTADIAVPVEEAIAPVEEVIAPAEDDAAPAEDAAPVEDEAVPAEDADKPVEDADKPAEDADKPAEDDAAPAEDADKPAEDDAESEEEVEEAEEVEVIFEDSGEVVTAEAADGYVGDSVVAGEPLTLNVWVNNPEFGNVVVTAGGNTIEHNENDIYAYSVPAGSTVVVEAVPNEGCSVEPNSFYYDKYLEEDYSEAIHPEDNPNTLTFFMDETIDGVYVRFAPPARTVIARINAGGGTITIMGNGEPKASTSEYDEISYSAAEDEEITIIAQPDEEFFEYTLLPGAFEVRKGDIGNETYPEFEPNADGTATLHVTPSADDTTYVDVSFVFKKVHVGLTDSADSSRYKTYNSVDHASMFKGEKGRWYFRFPENPFDDTLAEGTAPVYSNAGYTYQVGDCVALDNYNHFDVEVKTTIPVEVDGVEHGTLEVASSVARGSQFRIVAVPEKGYYMDDDGITVTCGDVSLEVEERDYNQFWCAVPEDPTGEKIVVSGTFTQMSPEIYFNNYEFFVEPNFEVSATIGGVPQDLVAFRAGNYTSYGYYADPGEEVVITLMPKRDINLNLKKTRASYWSSDSAAQQSKETVLATATANEDGSYTLSFTRGMYGCGITVEEYRPNIMLSNYDPNYVEVKATIDGVVAEMLDREGERGFYAEEGAKVVITLTAKNGASFDLSETSVNQYRSNAGGTVSLLPNGPVGNSQSCTLEFTQPSTEDYDNVWVYTQYGFFDFGVTVSVNGDSDEQRGEISVTVNGGEPVTMNGGNRMFVKANDGDKVTVKATPKEGYTLLPGAFNYLGDKYDGEKDGNSRTYTFTMEKEFDDGYRSVSVRFASSDVPTVTLGAEGTEGSTYSQGDATGEALFKAENGTWVFTFPNDYNPLGDEVPEGQKLVFVDDDDAENEPYDGDHAYAPGSTVEMEGDKRFHAEYRQAYDITILPNTGGTATVNMEKVAPGETIRVTLKPNPGYFLDEVIVVSEYPGDEYWYNTRWVNYNDSDRSEQYTVHVDSIPEDTTRVVVRPYFCKEWEESAPALPPATVAPAPAPAPAPAGPAITIAKAPAGVKAKAKKAKVTVSWKKIKKNKAGKALLKQIQKIEIQASTDPTFATNVTTKTVGKKKTKVNFSLQKKTTYFVRVRYVGADGVSNWSAVRKVKTKK